MSTDRVRRSRAARAPEPEGAEGGAASEAAASRAGTEPPLAVVAPQANTLRLVGVDAAAQAAGLHPGLTLREARARVPELDARPDDPAADARLQRRLVHLARRFTPALAVPAPDELVLDLAGCGPLFGGEAALVEAVRALFAREEVSLLWGLADTPDLARALARFAPHAPVAAPGASRAALLPLPVEALGLPAADAAALRSLGLQRVGDLLDRPRPPLAGVLEGRLGARLDALLGFAPTPLAPEPEAVRHRAERKLLEPVTDAAGVLHHVRRLAETVERGLETRGLGARRLRLELWGPDGGRRLTVRTPRPVRRAAEVADLYARRLELLGEGAVGAEGFDQLRLEAEGLEPVTPRVVDLAEAGPPCRFDDFARFVAGRYGEGALRRAGTDPATAKPEREAGWAPYDRAPTRGGGPAAPAPAWSGAVLRPLRLFDPPEPVDDVLFEAPDRPPVRFRWRRRLHAVRRAEGPERLSPEWNREGEDVLTRDYYRVEDEAGRRFWLFREGLLPAVVAPRWFLHGLFA